MLKKKIKCKVRFSFTTMNQVWNDGSGCRASNIATHDSCHIRNQRGKLNDKEVTPRKTGKNVQERRWLGEHAISLSVSNRRWDGSHKCTDLIYGPIIPLFGRLGNSNFLLGWGRNVSHHKWELSYFVAVIPAYACMKSAHLYLSTMGKCTFIPTGDWGGISFTEWEIWATWTAELSACVYGRLSQSFDTSSGVRQSRPTSPFLFNFVMDEVMRTALVEHKTVGVDLVMGERLCDLEYAHGTSLPTTLGSVFIAADRVEEATRRPTDDVATWDEEGYS